MSDECVQDEALFREIARYDWLHTGRHLVLHGPIRFDFPAGEWHAENVVFACGYTVDEASIPGFEPRMAKRRCSRCCDRLGFPRGVGSPKNDDECRRILELPTGPEADREMREALEKHMAALDEVSS